MRSIFARLHRRYGRKITGAEREAFVRAKMREQPQPPRVAERRAAFALDEKSRPKVAIIGGGFAGLMAGYSLVGRVVFCESKFSARTKPEPRATLGASTPSPPEGAHSKFPN